MTNDSASAPPAPSTGEGQRPPNKSGSDKPCFFVGSTGYDAECRTCGRYTSDFERNDFDCPWEGVPQEAPSPVPGDAGDLAGLSERATPGLWYTVDQPWGGSDWIVAGNPDPHAGSPVCNFDFFDEDRPENAPGPEDDAAFVAALVNAYRSGRLTPAAPRPAGEDLAGQGEPVAWAYEWLYDAGRQDWQAGVKVERPTECWGIRDIRPLYEAPAPSRTAVTEEEIARFAWACREDDFSAEGWRRALNNRVKYPGGYDDRAIAKALDAALHILSLFRDADRAAVKEATDHA